MSAEAAEIVLLTGGTGGAKLAAGIAAAYGPERLCAIVNTGDDIEIYGAHVSPDPDLVCFWLAGLIDERGWGLRGDSFEVMDALRALGVEVWFNLGDRDLAWCIERARLLAAGCSATGALARLASAIGVGATVLPVSDDELRTWVRTPLGWRPFQEFMIRDRAAGPVTGLEVRGAERAAPSAQVLAALEAARVIVIGPSNPLVSIGPMLAVPGMREALAAAPAPIVAVSPIVGGEVLKGPTAAFMEFAGHPCSAQGVLELYGGLLDGMLADEPLHAAPRSAGRPAARIADTRMDDAAARERVARETVAFAESI
ncbi:MAG TPA: 2-phospho-L-lactate transferase [Solirubrobacteraceae bacterium]